MSILAALNVHARRSAAHRLHRMETAYLDLLATATQEGDCIITTTTNRNPSGYAQLSLNKEMFLAHRLAWELVHGAIPRGKYVCHTCDRRLCINVNHLWLGSPKQNTHDARDKGRLAHGDNHGNAKLTWADVDAIRAGTNRSTVKLAKQYGVSPTVISGILRNKTWIRR